MTLISIAEWKFGVKFSELELIFIIDTSTERFC